MGLSLTAEVVGWVLTDAADGAVLDHDLLEVTDGTETAGAAALGAHAIATTAGLEVSCIRIAWSDDAAHAGRRLQSRLRTLALAPVEVVPQRCAMAVLVGPDNADMPSGIALAYGAALAALDCADADAGPPVRRQARFGPRRLATSVLGVAAALALGVFGLGAAGGPDIAPAATAVEQPAPAAPGWVAVPVAPPNGLAEPARKVVAVPAQAAAPAAEAPVYYPVQAVDPVAEVAPVAAPAALPEPEGLPHLSAPAPEAVPHIVAPLAPHAPGPELGVPHHSAAPVEEMTVSPNLFTALP